MDNAALSSHRRRLAAWRLEFAALLRFRSRNPPETSAKSTSAIAVGGARIDLADGRVRAADGAETVLRRQSAAVLDILAAARGATVGKAALHDAVWRGVAVTDDSLVQCVSDIRRALGPDREALKTVPGRGYRLDVAARAPDRQRPAFARLAGAAALGAAALAAAVLALRASDPASPGRSAADGPVVAVLPFENLAGDARWDRLARGATEEVIADLATNPWLFVLADATTRPHAGADPSSVRETLGAGYVVTGSIQPEVGQVRVAAALTDTASGRQVWGKQWQGPADDLLAFQTAAAGALVGELAGRYSGAIARADRGRAHRKKASSLEVYELYLLGVEHKHRFTLTDYDIAEGYLKRATELDPGFAKAWVVLSIIEGFRSSYATTDAELDAIDAKQRAYVARALAADPDDPATLIEASKLYAMRGDLAAAERVLRRAVELAPNDADILAVAAWSAPERAPIGREALAWAERAEALNPDRPDWYMAGKGAAAFAAGEYDLAAEALNAAPPEGFADRWLYLAAAEAMRGDLAAAKAAAAELRRQVPDFDFDWWFDGYPWEPGLRQRLREGAARAGLDQPPG